MAVHFEQPRGSIPPEHLRGRKRRYQKFISHLRLLLPFDSVNPTSLFTRGSARCRRARVSAITASSQKKRKLAPFASILTGNTHSYDHNSAQSLHVHPRRAPSSLSPSSSPQPPSSPSPTNTGSGSDETRNTTPPRFLPPHLHEEVLQQSKEFAAGGGALAGQGGNTEGSSPSGAFEQINIDSGSSVDMSGSENGGIGNEPQHQQQQLGSPGRAIGPRSVSPAKRSAADMEDGERSSQDAPPPGSFVNGQENGLSDFDQAMAGMTPAASDTMDTQETVSGDASAQVTITSDTSGSATSFQSDLPPPFSAADGQRESKYGDSRPPIDEQVKIVYEMSIKSIEEGQRGYIVSTKWLARVMSRSSDGLNNNEYAKEAREGGIGPMDNSDLVPGGAFVEPVLRDMEGEPFIPIKPGLVPGQDCQILPKQAYGLVVSWYGNTLGQKPIVRYAHNTADADATHENIQYELYPPVITIRKVPQPSQQTEQPPRTAPKFAVHELRLRGDRRGRGQMSPDDAVQFVSARSERFNKFLSRAKEAAGIPVTNKVRIWKLLDPAKVTVDNQQTGVLSPPASRSSSPTAARAPPTKLVLDIADFNPMEIGKDIEHIDAKDETNNSSYNGSSTMQVYTLFDDCSILLEEMILGPAGGDFPSDKKKKGGRLNLGKKSDGSRPGSTTASGRTSPAPGGGIMTRGRTRRDGRTRGTVGLSNLGNTCYMNSALQCIRSVEELAIYFLSQKYKTEINTTNPLGHKGIMAKQYSGVLESLYAENASGVFSPGAFKKTLGQLQPLFSGYGQQDSQEFLSFLVDALHEDLNRIQKKPYNENPDSDDKTVHDPQAIIKLGDTYRANHRARNDSIAMDLFNGFYKNTMECPVCGKISITFDPYSLLTLQLPIENTFQHTVTFVSLHGKPVNHMIDMDKNSKLKIVKDNVAFKHPGVRGDRLWMVEVYNHKIFKVFEDNITLAEAGIQTNDHIFVFELEGVPSNTPQPAPKKASYSLWSSSSRDEPVPEMDDPKGDRFAVPVFSRLKNSIVMHPMYILVTREEAKDFDTILKKVLVAMSRLTDRPILTEWDEDGTRNHAPAVNAEVEMTTVDDNAQLSDRSVPSEDGYVEVSKGEQTAEANVQMNGTATPAESQDDDRPIPPRFMDREYFISPALREHLFAVNYAQGESSGMYCTGMSSIQDRSIRNMFDRVKLPSRRASVQSSSSGEESTTSTGSGAQVNGESETSDADENGFDAPDIKIGEPESYLSLPVDGSSDEDLPDNPLEGGLPRLPRTGRGKRDRQGKKGCRNKIKTYSKKGKRGHHQNRPDSSGSLQSTRSHRWLGVKSSQEDDNPYYIKLGEGIVLDWHLDGFDGLFGGNTDEESGFRGQFISHSDGKGLPLVHDPEVVARRERRAARKTHGITLDDCFNETGKRETLSADNTWWCNRCKEMRQAAKTLEIWTIPDILVVHLKRFGGNRSFRDKIDVLVDYPIEGLDMTDRVGLKEDGKEYVYDLFAVDCHFGGLGGGHYTAMAKNFYDGQWYDYNGKQDPS